MPADWQLPTGVSRALWDYFHDPELARRYDASLEGTPLLQFDQQFVLEHCRPAGTLIDLGCGTGRLTLTLAQAMGKAGGLNDNGLYFVYNAGSTNFGGTNTNLVSLKGAPVLSNGREPWQPRDIDAEPGQRLDDVLIPLTSRA